MSDKLNLNCKHHFFETEIFWIFREGGARKRHRFVSKINNIPCEWEHFSIALVFKFYLLHKCMWFVYTHVIIRLKPSRHLHNIFIIRNKHHHSVYHIILLKGRKYSLSYIYHAEWSNENYLLIKNQFARETRFYQKHTEKSLRS